MKRISFYQDGVRMPNVKKSLLRAWIEEIILSHGKKLHQIDYIFCSDQELLPINKEFLNHSTLTDIITFDYSTKHHLHGEIYISLQRVKENAYIFQKKYKEEFLRVLCHGVLHLIGYQDKKEKDIKIMRKKEDDCISLFYSILASQ
ncbi:MAG: rRNA maturation RNase YbeY [Bacteroidota bacterium]